MSETVEVKVSLPKPPEGMGWVRQGDQGWPGESMSVFFRLRPIAPATVTLRDALQSARRTVANGPNGLTFYECDRLVGTIDAALNADNAARAALAAEGAPCGVQVHDDGTACTEPSMGSYPCRLPKHGPETAHSPEAQR